MNNQHLWPLKKSKSLVSFRHLFVWNLNDSVPQLFSLNLNRHNFIRIIRKQLVLFRYGTDSSRKLCNEFKLGNFCVRKKTLLFSPFSLKFSQEWQEKSKRVCIKSLKRIQIKLIMNSIKFLRSEFLFSNYNFTPSRIWSLQTKEKSE